MKLGFGLPVGGAWATPDSLVRVGRQAESLGYHSLWVFQRLLYPREPRNEYYGTPGAPWPEAFQSVLDPVVALTWVAAHTGTIRLGASVLLIPFYSPVALAKQLASLDIVAGGRLHVGLGLGWSVDEYEAVGASTHRRGARADEFIRCLKAVWTEDEVSFRGEFYTVPASRIEPKPVQKPHPPILVGGYSEGVLRRAAELGDGYAGGNIPLTRIAEVIGRVREAAARAGRDPEAFPIVCRGAYHVMERGQGRDRRPLWGSLDEVRGDIDRYAAAGVSELFLDPNFQPGGPRLERVLGELEALASRSRRPA